MGLGDNRTMPPTPDKLSATEFVCVQPDVWEAMDDADRFIATEAE
jgi:hypothetical protein